MRENGESCMKRRKIFAWTKELVLCNVLFHALKNIICDLSCVRLSRCQMPIRVIALALGLPILAASDGNFKLVRNWFYGIDSASIYSLAGLCDNPIPTRFLASIDSPKIPALCVQSSRHHWKYDKRGVIVGLSVECLWCCTEHLICDVVYVGQKQIGMLVLL